MTRIRSLHPTSRKAGQYVLDCRALFVEMPLHCLAEPVLKIATSKVAGLLELAAERTHELAFGLHIEAALLGEVGEIGQAGTADQGGHRFSRNVPE
jgi:hypothetical protein